MHWATGNTRTSQSFGHYEFTFIQDQCWGQGECLEHNGHPMVGVRAHGVKKYNFILNPSTMGPVDLQVHPVVLSL